MEALLIIGAIVAVILLSRSRKEKGGSPEEDNTGTWKRK
jgi:hypothetical protein